MNSLLNPSSGLLLIWLSATAIHSYIFVATVSVIGPVVTQIQVYNINLVSNSR